MEEVVVDGWGDGGMIFEVVWVELREVVVSEAVVDALGEVVMVKWEGEGALEVGFAGLVIERRVRDRGCDDGSEPSGLIFVCCKVCW